MLSVSKEGSEILRQQLEDLEKIGYPNLEEINDVEDQGDGGNFQRELLKIQVS